MNSIDKFTNETHTNINEWALNRWASNRLFAQPASFYCETPFVRPIRPQDISSVFFEKIRSSQDLTASDHLIAQRILTNLYEQDLVFLPSESHFALEDMRTFYDESLRSMGGIFRPRLEKKVFGWLDDALSIDGEWDLDSFETYSASVFKDLACAPSLLLEAVNQSLAPREVVNFFLIQCASDFLSEASAMARNVLGNFGPAQSELFKILIDEYGYGVPAKKHSTIFEQLLEECGLEKSVHYYWQFYTASSLALSNYFHYISSNHALFFRYLGALYYTEASLAFVTKGQSKAIKAAYGDSVSTLYFDEHAHIDVHHGRMAFGKLIKPIVERYGVQILPEIVRGFEEFRLLQDVADQDFHAHIAWHEEIRSGRLAINPAHSPPLKSHVFHEPLGELSVTHMHEREELFRSEEGAVTLVCSPTTKITLAKGEGVVIPAGMLHGSIVTSPHCSYSVTHLD
jgi:Iron-containing redox enzyme